MSWDERIARNPFYVLELRPGATAVEIAHTGQRLLAALSVGVAGSSTYPTPLGPQVRDEPAVRWAVAELADPDRRAVHALWAALPAEEPPIASAGWPEAFAAMGWRRR